MKTPEPCMCGALDCPVCGRLQGTYDDYHTQCGNCDEIMADCGCENPEPMEKDCEEPEPEPDYEPDDYDYDRIADEYERGIGY